MRREVISIHPRRGFLRPFSRKSQIEFGGIKRKKDILEDFCGTTSGFDTGLDALSDCW